MAPGIKRVKTQSGDTARLQDDEPLAAPAAQWPQEVPPRARTVQSVLLPNVML